MQHGTISNGNTPTGVGKTPYTDNPAPFTWKHPHGRGEDWHQDPNEQGDQGNTPTGVGKTRAQGCRKFRRRKHPHGRGEDSPTSGSGSESPETPPRAWGRPPRAGCITRRSRNTPTGVGKTKGQFNSFGKYKKHPHGRGEDQANHDRLDSRMETPPRAWGRHQYIVKDRAKPATDCGCLTGRVAFLPPTAGRLSHRASWSVSLWYGSDSPVFWRCS